MLQVADISLRGTRMSTCIQRDMNKANLTQCKVESNLYQVYQTLIKCLSRFSVQNVSVIIMIIMQSIS